VRDTDSVQESFDCHYSPRLLDINNHHRAGCAIAPARQAHAGQARHPASYILYLKTAARSRNHLWRGTLASGPEILR
jgi:hypothetical protein